MPKNNIHDTFVFPDVCYGSNPQLDKLVDSEKLEDRLEAAKKGYAPEVLVFDRSWRVRKEVAKNSYFFSILVEDSDWRVRLEVAKQWYGHDKLKNDPCKMVRNCVKKMHEGVEQNEHEFQNK